MLKEIALTPHVFDEGSYTNPETLLEHLRTFGTYLTPFGGVCPLVVSNLYNGSWKGEALNTIRAMTNPGLKLKAQAIFQRISHLLVRRPAVCNWPEDDEAWAMEAIHSSQGENKHIDRILACASTSAKLKNDGHDVYGFGELESESLWRNMRSDGHMPMIIQDQIKRLRIISLHADFISVASPYIKGTDTDETRFALNLISVVSSVNLNDRVLFDVHFEGPRDVFPNGPSFQDRLSTLISNIKIKFENVTSGKVNIRLHVWPKLRERILLAGSLTTVNGEPTPKARWGIHCGHIARPGENDPDDLTEWKLLFRRGISYWFNHFYGQTERLLCSPVEIGG